MNRHLALLWFMLRIAVSVGLSVTGLLLVADGIGTGPAVLVWCVCTGLGLFLGRILGFRKGFRRATKIYMNDHYPRSPRMDYVSAYPPEFTRTGEFPVVFDNPREDGEAAFLAYLEEFEPGEAQRKSPWLELTADIRIQWRSIARAVIKNHASHDTFLDTNAEATQASNFVDRVKAHQATINNAVPMTDHRSI